MVILDGTFSYWIIIIYKKIFKPSVGEVDNEISRSRFKKNIPKFFNSVFLEKLLALVKS